MTTNVTKEQFISYLRVQKQGKYNMLDPRSRKLTGLPVNVYSAIIKNYSELSAKFNLTIEDV